MLHCGEVSMGTHMRASAWLYTIGVILSIAFAIIFTPHSASAQTKLEFSGASLKLTPTYPGPESEVTVALDAYTYDTSGAIIVWKIDGEEQAEFENERSITIQTGELGDAMQVSATVLTLGGGGFTLKKTIVPAVLDIIVEADTYVPPFYRGRALGTAKANLRVTAVPHNGEVLDPRELTFTWEHNEAILFGGPVRGRQSVDITMPQYSGGYVKVSVMDDNRETVAEKRVALTAIKPEIYFYEENILRGLSEMAIKNSFALVGDETTVHGEPYYLAGGVDTDTLAYEWRINRNPITNESSDPHIITLRKTGDGGSALVTLRALTKELIPQYVQDDFTISF